MVIFIILNVNQNFSVKYIIILLLYNMKYKYKLIIDWSESDQCYIVEVPELFGCMADGETYQEAVSNAEIIIKEWLDTAKYLQDKRNK